MRRSKESAATPRAGIYVRVSTNDQEKTNSPEEQEALCRRFAEERGYDVVAVFRDTDSGANLGRKRFNDMLEAATSRTIDAIVCKEPDRLARNVSHLSYALVTAEKAGVEVAFVFSPPATTLEGRILETVRGIVADVERTSITTRLQGGLRSRVYTDLAYLPGSRAPYGLMFKDPVAPVELLPNGKKARGKTRLVIDPVTGPIVRRMFEHIAAGLSSRSLERSLTAEGVATPSDYAKGLPASKRWLSSSIRHIMENPIYKGDAAAFRWKVKRPHLAKVDVPLDPITEPFLLPPGTAEAIVSPELWQRANDQLHLNRLYGTHRNQDPEATLLRAGHAVCGYCGKPCCVNKVSWGYIYRCAPYNRDTNGCPSFGMSARALDGAVWTRVEEVLTNPEYVKDHMQQWLGLEDTSATEIRQVEDELADIEGKERRLAPQLAVLDDPTSVVHMLNDLSTRKQVLAGKRRDLETRRTSYERAVEGWESLLKKWEWYGVAVHPRLQNMTYAERRFWLANLNVRAEVWCEGKGPEGQQYRISMDIDENLRLPEYEYSPEEFAEEQAAGPYDRVLMAHFHASYDDYVNTRGSASSGTRWSAPSGAPTPTSEPARPP